MEALAGINHPYLLTWSLVFLGGIILLHRVNDKTSRDRLEIAKERLTILEKFGSRSYRLRMTAPLNVNIRLNNISRDIRSEIIECTKLGAFIFYLVANLLFLKSFSPELVQWVWFVSFLFVVISYSYILIRAYKAHHRISYITSMSEAEIQGLFMEAREHMQGEPPA